MVAETRDRKINTDAKMHNDGVKRLPHERDETPDGQDKDSVYGRERLGGRFRRAVSLPDDVDPERVQANYKDGVLHISIARHEAAQPKRITIQ